MSVFFTAINPITNLLKIVIVLKPTTPELRY